MVRIMRTDYYGLLSFVIVIAGCALPTDRSEPTAIMAVSSPLGTPPAANAESRPDSPTTAKNLQVAYEAPAENPPAPPKPSAGEAPLSEGVPSGPIQPAPLSGQSVTNVVPLREEASEHVPPQSAYRSDDPSDPFIGQAELSVEQLVAEVQARNPSLQAAIRPHGGRRPSATRKRFRSTTRCSPP